VVRGDDTKKCHLSTFYLILDPNSVAGGGAINSIIIILTIISY